jgi:hypothetical protein
VRCCCGRGRCQSSGRPGRDGRRVGVEEAGVSHLSSIGSGSEVDCSDMSVGNEAECERTGRSSRGHLDGRMHPNVQSANVLNTLYGAIWIEHSGRLTPRQQSEP